MNKCLCGSIKSTVIFSGNWNDESGKIPFSLKLCKKCGLIRTDPAPTNTTSDNYVNQREANEDLWVKFAQDLLGFIYKNTGKKTGSLLDVGASVGILVKVANERGYTAMGIDVDKEAISYGKKKYGVQLKHTDIENSGFKENSYDLVVLSHTLEHVRDCNRFLETIKRLLKKDGILVIEVPNIEGLPSKLQRLRGKNWYGLDPRHHLWHFNPTTIYKLLTKSGYKNIKINTTKSLYYENNKTFNDIIKCVFIRIGEMVGKADQIRLVAYPIK